MARRLFIAGNWKMNRGPGEAAALARALRAGLLDAGVDLAVAPPFPAIPEVVAALRGTGVGVAGQNCHWERSGAFTGEVSAEMLAAAGCTHVIVGHSERRHLFGETDATVNKKLHAVLRAGLSPILCVGETLAQREEGRAVAVVQEQLAGGLERVSTREMERVTLAYEPVWAIGTGRTASPEQAQEMHRAIRDWLARRYDPGLAATVRIQYGGSVKPSNARALLSQPDIDGALVGGASLDAGKFLAIVEQATRLPRA